MRDPRHPPASRRPTLPECGTGKTFPGIRLRFPYRPIPNRLTHS